MRPKIAISDKESMKVGTNTTKGKVCAELCFYSENVPWEFLDGKKAKELYKYFISSMRSCFTIYKLTF